MSAVDKSIVVEVPVTTAYNQWTQFEEFPRFMEGVEEVQQRTDTTLHWRAKIAGKEEEWDAEIVQQVPDRRISWRSISGRNNSGDIEFEPVTSQTTRVTAHMEYEPSGPVEKAGDAAGMVSRQVEGDLERFKKFVEERGVETGAWRGQVGQ